MKATEVEMIEQAEFCRELMKRLVCDMKSCGHIKVTVVKDDVRRLRKELNILSKMCEWEWSIKGV